VGARPGPRPAGPPPTTGRPPPQPAAPCRTGAPTTPPSSTAASAPAATPLRSVRADPVQPGQHVLPQQLRARQRDQQLPTGQATATALDRPDPGIQRRPPPAGPPARTPPASPPPASTTDPTRRPEPVDATHLHQVFCSPNGCLPTTRTGCLRQLQFSGETGTLFTSPRRHALPPISLTADLSQSPVTRVIAPPVGAPAFPDLLDERALVRGGCVGGVDRFRSWRGQETRSALPDEITPRLS